MNKKFLAIIITLFAVFGFLLVGEVKAGPGDNVSGWAWSNMDDPITPTDERSIGWISFNSTNCDSNNDGITDTGNYSQCPVGQSVSDYGVKIDSDGTFSDYAWAGGGENTDGTQKPTIGWVHFAPAGPYPTLPDYSAKVDSTGQVSGWARVCNVFESGCSGTLNPNRGGWDGWIKLRGSNYGVSINTENGEFSGWAWSDMVIGWIHFEGVKTTFSFNNPPNKPISGGVTWSGGCVYVIAIPTFPWIYSDPDYDLQTGYQIRVRTNSTFPVDPQGNAILQSDEFKCGGQVCSAENQSPSFSPISQEWISWAAYNTEYYWTVRVKDGPDNWSEWSTPASFNTPAHTYPRPDFIHQPETPSAGEEVTFIDSSVCYNADNSPYSCKDNAGNHYLWDFGDGNSCDGFGCRGDVTHNYEVQDDYTVRLFVTDDIGTCDTAGDTPVSIRLPLPEYKEVPPTIWLEKFFAGVINFFDGFLKFN